MNKNIALLTSFTAYCKENPSQRFWQALFNWASIVYEEKKFHHIGFDRVDSNYEVSYSEDTYNLE